MDLKEKLNENLELAKKGSKGQKINLHEALTTPDLSTIIQRTIIDVMRDAAEPVYIASNFFKKVRLTEGRSIVFPSIAAIRAYEVTEGGNYREETLDTQIHEATFEVKAKKYGVKVSITEEMLEDSQWDLIGILLTKAGQAMARLKEEKCFEEFTNHGHTIFDAEASADNADYGADYQKYLVHGLDINAQFNKTMNDEDFFDMFVGLMANRYVPTDVLLHPLVWPMFAKNQLLDKMPIGAFGANNNSITVSPDAVNGRLPFALTVTLSPFIPFDAVNKKFDMYVVDRNEVGVMLVKEDLTTEQWSDPERDIQNLKLRERWGTGLWDDGNAICVARNIKFAKSYPYPDRVKQVTGTDFV